ncbi:cytidylyltransferase domain-containing protein [Aliamphritea ceti]|uniref:cytidylyltransferase domain-containing protein n=1 Tax=Aliamphritea ceti TaxID=1524258 RepID=UPI0021C3B318|nr:hypothetical protein [Aliamphritea ceti]
MIVDALIPAKMTSQRILEKNFAFVGEHRLIDYAMNTAKCVKSFRNVYVSSESDRILSHVTKCGGRRALKRPLELSHPDVKNIDVIYHFLTTTYVGESLPDYVVLLQPSHPFRVPADLELALNCITASDSNVNVCYAITSQDENDSSEVFVRFDGNPQLINTGAFYILKTKEFLAQRTIKLNDAWGLKISHPNFEVDIDEVDDLDAARRIYTENKLDLDRLGILP